MLLLCLSKSLRPLRWVEALTTLETRITEGVFCFFFYLPLVILALIRVTRFKLQLDFMTQLLSMGSF